jgi:hypothetical protein
MEHEIMPDMLRNWIIFTHNFIYFEVHFSVTYLHCFLTLLKLKKLGFSQFHNVNAYKWVPFTNDGKVQTTAMSQHKQNGMQKLETDRLSL